MTRAIEDYLESLAPRGRKATRDDLWNCYRLLLDREPDEGGFEAYSAMVERGCSCWELVCMFTSSPEFMSRSELPINPTISKAQLDGFELYIPTADAVVGEHILKYGNYEPHVIPTFKSTVRRGDTVVDIGANIGYFSVIAAQAAGPEGRVYAFEPLMRNVRLLVANAMINKLDNVITLPFAAGAKEGFLSLMAMGSIASSREAVLDDLIRANALEFTYAKRVDDSVPSDKPVGVLKIDVDGFDYHAIQGAQGILDRDHPHVFAEFLPRGLKDHSGIDPVEYLRFFKARGYDRFVLLDHHKGPTDMSDNVEDIVGLPEKLGFTHVDLHISKK